MKEKITNNIYFINSDILIKEEKNIFILNKGTRKKTKNISERIISDLKKIKLIIFQILIVIIFFFFLFFILKIWRINNNKIEIKTVSNRLLSNDNISIFNKPILPLSNNEYIVKAYHKTYYDSNNIRYHYNDLFKNRKIFKINYNYISYININKEIPYDENANNIYTLTGMLNITMLDKYYYGINFDSSNLNHIHLSMSFDKNYILLSSISIASILNTSSLDTFIHFHIILNNCTYYDIKDIINLRQINKKVDFVFYNGKQAQYDFGDRSKNEWRGVGEYSRLLIPEIVNNTNKIIILDSGDIIAEKDLSEIYFYDIGDNYFGFSLECNAGRFNDYYIFGRNNFNPNGGVVLVNIRKFREDNIYRNAYFSSMAYNFFPCPFQEIMLIISNYKFKFLPLNFNAPQFFENDEQLIQKNNNTKSIIDWMICQNYSIFKHSNQELLESSLNPVITHLYGNKPYFGKANKKYTNIWINYAKIIGIYERVKVKYPDPFKKYSLDNN